MTLSFAKNFISLTLYFGLKLI